MAPRHRDGDVVASVSGKWVSWVHTVAAYAAFLGALIVGVALHYKKIVQNEHYGYPQEWFPSVSATIGDRYPERSVFQVFIAITSGPRFALVALWYLLTARPGTTLPKFVAGVGIFRTLTCGGWTYVTSTDDHKWHDIFMISYLMATLPWTLGCLALSPRNPTSVKYRKILAGAFFGTLVPLLYFFIQHKVHKVPGAYTTYAFFEWSLVLLDVAFDAVTAMDFEGFELVVKDVRGTSRGNNKTVVDAVLEKEKDKQAGQVFGPRFSWPDALDAAADVYNGFIFWSILTSLGVLVWYFPLWHMGLSGWEVIIMSTVSPVSLGIGPLRRFVIQNIRWMHLLTLTGLLAYLVKSPEYRLLSVGFAVCMSCLSWAATLYAERSQPARLEARISAFGLGLMASTIAKFAFWTNNPIWPVVHAQNGGWNKTGLALAILAVLRSTRRTASSGGEAPSPRAEKGSSALAGLGLAGLFFAMHSLLSDSSTMILWVWEGYPVRGPLAVPHGSYTIFAMGVGLLIGLFYTDFARSWTFFGTGSVAAAVLTTYSDWFGYYGALVLAAYIMALAPVLISSAVRHSPPTTFGLGFLVYNILVLAHVWIVAYAFVPGGFLMREHTDYVMTVTMLCMGAGVFSAQASEPNNGRKSTNPAARKQRGYYIYVLVALQLLSACIAYLRFPSYNYTPYHKDEKLVTAGIWTIHFSLDNDMWTSERRMRDAIKELEIDVIGLLESDLQRIIMGNRDTTQYIAEDLGMYVDYGPGPNKHTWGSALLSKFPIVNSTHHLLPSPVGELAPAIHATLDMYGELVDVFLFHSGQEEDVEDRRLQSEYLAQLMRSSPRPSILLSYLVTKPNEGNYKTYVGEKSGMRDIDPSDWDRWCEYILYKGLRRTGYARVSRGTITDTEIQLGKFAVGEPEGSDTLIAEEHVPLGRRFPALFRGEGVRGHRYHVFDEPRYFE
ncbi:calcofluor white hypersensitive protein [Cryomyces antarcticus]